MNTLHITPALIPHKDFHKGAWLLSVKRPDWYYFMKKQNTNTIKAKFFLKSVDRPLRKLVGYLHKKGIKTTPSCSGHHVIEKSYEKIYEALVKDMEAIRTEGIYLKDVETGEIYHYQNSHYKLPWSRKQFARRATAYQRNGVIGLKMGNRKNIVTHLKDIKIQGVRIEEIDSILFIFTKENKKHNIAEMWQKVTDEVIKLL